jgi:maltooligosyltrehalose trehalohydrolase
MPIGYFGVDERFGNRADFQRLVDAAHQHGMAVILDAVYGHTDSSFTYSDLYRRLGYEQNPFLGSFAKDYYGESIDFSHPFTQDFFFSVNYLWLDRFHIDGFRYDCVPEYWDGATGVGYANLVYNTYQIVKAAIPEGGYWQRFGNGNQINLIQCAEQLEDPQGVLNQSYSTATWQDALLGNAQDVAHGNFGALTELGMQLGLIDYPTQLIQNDDILQKTAFQYLENHDHERFVCNFGLENPGEMLLQDGNRSLWYKVQPYLIGLLAAKGVPMLWQGQEFGENYWIPPGGVGRVMLFRPVRWDYFYDDTGKLAIGLVRRLIRLRQQLPELRSGDHYFYNQWDLYQSHGLLLFSRISGNRFTLIALNFTDSEQTVPFWFPSSGDYAELLDAYPGDTLAGVNAFDQVQLTIPSNYGRIWSLVV